MASQQGSQLRLVVSVRHGVLTARCLHCEVSVDVSKPSDFDVARSFCVEHRACTEAPDRSIPRQRPSDEAVTGV